MLRAPLGTDCVRGAGLRSGCTIPELELLPRASSAGSNFEDFKSSRPSVLGSFFGSSGTATRDLTSDFIPILAQTDDVVCDLTTLLIVGRPSEWSWGMSPRSCLHSPKTLRLGFAAIGFPGPNHCTMVPRGSTKWRQSPVSGRSGSLTVDVLGRSGSRFLSLAKGSHATSIH